jgi:hypothetical protein
MADLLNQFTNSMPGASGPSSPQSSYPSSNMAANNTFGSYASPSYEQSGLGTLNGAGGSSGALPLEGQYGIVKMASGGRVGLRSVAKELQDMGRGGDTILAHINPQEAALLKRMGGSGTINPNTGLPEYWGIKLGPVRIGSDYGGLSIGRTSIGDVLDKSGVADLISKLGPVAPMAAAYFGGPLAAGIVGGIGKEGKFNFQRALMSGALAYGAQNLAQGLSASSDAALTSAADMGAPAVTDVAASLGVPAATVPGSQAAMLAEQAAGFGNAGLANIGSSAGYSVGPGSSAFVGPAYEPSFLDKVAQTGSNFGTQVKDAASGAYNLSTGAPGASEAFKASGATLTNTALPIYAGATGVMAIDEAEKAQLEADLANAKSQEEYNAIMARIEASRQRGIAAMQRNPYMFAEGGEVPILQKPRFGEMIQDAMGRIKAGAFEQSQDPALQPPRFGEMIQDAIGRIKTGGFEQPQGQIESSKQQGLLALMRNGGLGSIGSISGMFDKIKKSIEVPKDYEVRAAEAMKANPYMFAYGGSVDDEPGADDLGIASMAKGGTPPRFLSGGGDGMSDDIPAVIAGKQPARLADGEFVIPADVVSHLGNGSSKAGAKQLYSMMDKVRTARTGNKKQGKQITPAKYMPA